MEKTDLDGIVSSYLKTIINRKNRIATDLAKKLYSSMGYKGSNSANNLIGALKRGCIFYNDNRNFEDEKILLKRIAILLFELDAETYVIDAIKEVYGDKFSYPSQG